MLGDGKVVAVSGGFVAEKSEETGIRNPVTGDFVTATMEVGTANGVFNELVGNVTRRIANVWRMSTVVDGLTYSATGFTRNAAFENLTRELSTRLEDGVPF